MSKKLEKILKDSYLASGLPEQIHIPPLGQNRTEVTKPLEEATLDDIALAIQGLDKVETNLYALRRIYREARSNGAIGSDNIVDAVTGKKGGV